MGVKWKEIFSIITGLSFAVGIACAVAMIIQGKPNPNSSLLMGGLVCPFSVVIVSGGMAIRNEGQKSYSMLEHFVNAVFIALFGVVVAAAVQAVSYAYVGASGLIALACLIIATVIEDC